jgi:hypothetical protein
MAMRLGRVARTRVACAALAAMCALAGFLAAKPLAATAISSDYCGYGLTSGQVCFEGSGYRGWRYHQAQATRTVDAICAQSWTGSNYRTGSACYLGADFYSFCNYYDTPAGNSSVNWGGGGASPTTVYGHADSSTSHTTIIANNGC